MYEFVLYERPDVVHIRSEETLEPIKELSPVIKEIARCSGEAAEVAMFLRGIADRLAPFRPHSGPVFRSQRPSHPAEGKAVDLRPDLHNG